MNEMNELENLLRSWAPRHPSARLKDRVFPPVFEPLAAPALPGTTSAALGVRLGWLAPATLAVLLMGVLFNERNLQVALSSSAGPGSLVAAALSNQSAAAWLPGSFTLEQNSVPADTFKRAKDTLPVSGVSALRTGSRIE
jgi:hypothetical protein